MNEVLNLLFDDTDLICVGNLYTNKVTTLAEAEKGEFFSINPLASVDTEYQEKINRSYMKPRRADMNVKLFRNFMFEMDSLHLDDQLMILSNCGINWSSIVYSGGKSYHAILSLENHLGGMHTKSGINQYKLIWRRLESFVTEYARSLNFEGAVIDPSSKNPSRFSRFPYYQAEDRNIQRVIHVGSRMSEADFEDLLQKCPAVKCQSTSNSVYDGEVQDLEEFWKLCPDGLKMKIKYPLNIQSEGNYGDLYRLCLWAIDSTGLSKEMMIQLCEEYIFPKYVESGYPEDRWMNGIDHAFSFKGVN